MPLAYFLILSVALFMVGFTHSKLTTAMEKQAPSFTSVVVPSPQAVRLVSLGFDQLVADFYWLQFVGYVGDIHVRKQDHYAKADQFIDLITSLDPQFVQAYWFASFTVGGGSEATAARGRTDRPRNRS